MNIVARICVLLLNICVLVTSNYDYGSSSLTSQLHHRSKRSTPSTTNLTFTIEKTNGWQTLTTIKVAQKADFKVTVYVPLASVNLRMEFSAPVESGGAVMALCSPRITSVGSNLGFMPSDKLTVQKSSDYAYIDLGTLSNSNTADTTADNFKIVIEFQAVLLNYFNITFGTKQYMVNAGASYTINNSKKLWVGQGPFTATQANLASGQLPTMALNGPNQVIPGTTAVWNVTMVLKDAANAIVADIFMPFNASNVMSLCRINVGTLGEGMSCYNKDVYPNTTYTKNKNYTDLVSMGTINLGNVTNSAFWNNTATDADKTLTLEFAAFILNNTAIQTVDQKDLTLGVAVQFDDKTIWSSIKNLTLSTNDVGTNDTPVFSVDASVKSLPVHAMTAIQINMSAPMWSSERYILELELPANGSSPMEACGFRVRYTGFNYPCFKAPNATYTSQNNNGVKDYIKVDFGVITNTGQRSDNDSNHLIFEFLVRMRSGAGQTSEQVSKIVAGIMYGGKAMWVGCTNVTYAAIVTQPSNAPEFRVDNVMNNRDKRTIYKGGQTAFYADMKLPIGSYYPSIQLMVSAPYDNSSTPYKPQLYLCSVRIKHMGINIPCNNESREATLNATLNPTKEKLPDSAGQKLTNISNIGSTDFGDYIYGTYNDSVIRFEAIVGVADDSRMTDGQTYWVKFGIQYWSTLIWVAHIGVKYSKNTTDLQANDMSPQVEFKRESKTFTVKAGGAAHYCIYAYLSPRTVATYAAEAFVQSNHTLSICRIGIKDRGAHIPCPYPKNKAIHIAYDAPSTQFDRAYYNIGTVADVGQRTRTSANKADDLMKVCVAVGVHPLAALVNGANHTFSVAMTMGTRQLLVASGMATIDTRSSSLTVSPTTYLILNSASSNIVIGGSKSFFVDIYIPPNTLGSYKIEAYAPSNVTFLGKMGACGLHLISAAWNIPCINGTMANVTYPKDSKNRTFTRSVLAVGNVHNIEESLSTIEHKDNVLRAGFSVTALEDVGLKAGDELFIGATVGVGETGKNDESQLWVGQHKLTVVDALFRDGEKLTNLSYTLKPPETPTGAYQRIGAIGTWKAIIKMPAMTGKVTLNVTTPHAKGEALATVVDIRPLNTRYVPCAERAKPKFTKTSETTNNQKTFVSATFMATLTEYENQWLPVKDEDFLVVAIDLQITDHIDNNNASAINFQTGVLLTDDTDTLSSLQSATAYALRDGTERPELRQSVAILPLNDTIVRKPGEDMLIFIHFNHTVNSTAHAFQANARLSLPPAIAQTPPVITNWTFLQPNSTSFVNGSFNMMFDKIFFVDNVTLTLLAKLDPNSEIPIGSGEMKLNAYLEIFYSLGDRANGYAPSTNYSTNVSAIQQKLMVPECSSIITIDSLQSCQVTWEPTSRPYSTAASAKWPRDVSFPKGQSLQFAFGNMTRIMGLQLRLMEALDKDLQLNISIASSNDGLRWQNHLVKGTTTTKVYTTTIAASGSVVGNTIRVNFTEGTMVGRYIRVKVSVNNKNLNKRFPWKKVTMDLFGCSITKDVAANAVCTAQPPVEMFERGIIVDPAEGALYACVITDTQDQASCSVTRDLGATWTEIDEEIVNINYYVKSSKKLLGLSSNRKTRMSSVDGGHSWFSMSDLQYDADISDINNVLGVQTFTFDGSLVGLATPLSKTELEINATAKFGVDSNGINKPSWTLIGYWDI